jgi:hypothetical protein
MSDQQASRTLVKSAPELWAECSDAASLAKHLGAFGEIRITKLEPETAVAWEGDAARGTVRLEPSGWGTRVVLTADSDVPAQESHAEPEPEAGAQPEAGAEPEPPTPEVSIEPPRGLLNRVFHRWPRRGREAPSAAPAEPEAGPVPEPIDGRGQVTVDALDAALDSLGRAHHRPYSRS